MIQTLFLSRCLDSHLESIQSKEDSALPFFTASYLARRVQNECNNGNPSLLRIRSVAERLCQENPTGQSVQEYIQQLCSQVIIMRSERTANIWKSAWEIDTSDFETHVFVAALYTQTMSVVSKWIRDGLPADQCSWLFGAAREHAAKYGDHQLLAAFMVGHHRDQFHCSRYHLLTYVAEEGRADATQFVWEYGTDQHPWEFTRTKRPRYAFQNKQTLAFLDTPSEDVLSFITEKRRLHLDYMDFGPKAITRFLINCAKKGWMDMAACYLDLGAWVDGRNPLDLNDENRPLVCACKSGHGQMVRLLLERGAKTCPLVLEVAAEHGHLAIVQQLLDHGIELGNAVEKAAAKGYWDIVHKLFIRGADNKDTLQRLLVHTIEHENEAMFRFLLARGASLNDGTTKVDCEAAAMAHGLESMQALLAETSMFKSSYSQAENKCG